MRKVKSISTSNKGVVGLYNSPSVNVFYEPNIMTPIMYCRRPKWLTVDEFSVISEDLLSQIKGLSQKSVDILENKAL